MDAAKIRIIANACVVRYNRGDGSINQIIQYYAKDAETRSLIIKEIEKLDDSNQLPPMA